MTKLQTVAVLAALASTATAQTTHLVGPSGLPEIRDALAIAAPGDRIHVEAGSYAHFEATVGVTIRALVPGSVQVRYDAAFAPPNCSFFCQLLEGPTYLSPPPGQELHVVGIDFAPSLTPQLVGGQQIVHQLEVTSGRVTLDDCHISSLDRHALTVRDASCHLQGCSAIVVGTFFSAAGLAVENADVTAVDCAFSGTGGLMLTSPGVGVQLTGGRLHGSGLTIYGNSGSGIGTSAVEMDGDSALWLTDSELIAGPDACAVTGAGVQRLDRCTITDNAGGCAPPAVGNEMLGVERPGPLAPGGTFALTFHSSSNGLIVVFASPLLDALSAFPVLEQPLWLDEPNAFAAALLVADTSGLASATWAIPADPWITDRTLWFQGLGGPLFPLQLSPVVGGVAR